MPSPYSPDLMAALASLLAHADPHVRRAAAESDVALDPRGSEAPPLTLLHANPAALVAMPASGWLLDPEHESAELKGLIRAVLRTCNADSRGFVATLARWHQALWLYSPNPRAVEVTTPITDDRLELDAAELATALAQLVEEQPVPAHIELRCRLLLRIVAAERLSGRAGRSFVDAAGEHTPEHHVRASLVSEPRTPATVKTRQFDPDDTPTLSDGAAMRAPPGMPASSATCPYVATRPRGCCE